MAIDRPDTAGRVSPPASRLVFAVAAVAFLLGAAAATTRNLERLRSLPLSRRETLAENLARFERMDLRDQERARRFDRQIDEIEDPEERRRLLDLLNRYHSWVERLSEDKRAVLRKTESHENRLELIRKYRAESLDEARRFDAIWTNSGAFAPRSLFLTAHFLRCWNAIDDAQRQRIDAAVENRAFENRAFENRNRFLLLNHAARLKRVLFVDSFRPIRESLLKNTVLIHGGKRVLPIFERFLQDLKEKKPRRANIERWANNRKNLLSVFGYLVELAEDSEEEKRAAEWPTPIEQIENLYWFAPDYFTRVIRPLEARYLEEHANQLPVLPRELIDFEETAPPWILQPNVFDQLPAEEARRRLTFLYHLVHSPTVDPSQSPPKPQVAPKRSSAKKSGTPKSYPR